MTCGVYKSLEDHLRGHCLAVLRSQMSVSFRYQCRVRMSKPVCEREEINSRLHRCRAKQMPKIVVTEPLDAEFLASVIDRLLALSDRENVTLTLPAPCVPGIRLHVGEKRSHCRNDRNPPTLSRLGSGMFVSGNPDLLALTVDVRPLHPSRFIDATA